MFTGLGFLRFMFDEMPINFAFFLLLNMTSKLTKRGVVNWSSLKKISKTKEISL